MDRLAAHHLEQTEKLVVITRNALQAVKTAAEQHQRITHEKHIAPFYAEAISFLSRQLAREEARLFRIRTIGR